MLPLIVPRAEHGLSRRDVDPDALKVLYRLKEAGFKAYLVGGGVRDLLLGRRPKDFDIGTDAHPQQIKKLFRNAWIIGRRFRLVHVKFGTKVIEVATFRRQIDPNETPDPAAEAGTGTDVGAGVDERGHLAGRDEPMARDDAGQGHAGHGHSRHGHGGHGQAIHHDNTFGTDEEDAFRRDFTINALFYDIATFSIIDFVGGLDDLRAGVIRCIGDPNVRFHEDPVRMQRAVSFAARLDFTLDPPVSDAIARHGRLLATSAPARLMDEYYKILRSGVSGRIFAALGEAGLLKALAPRLHAAAKTPELRASLARLDAYRQGFDASPESLTNAILIGSLLVPLGFNQGSWPAWMQQDGKPGLNLGIVPLARRDVERLHQVLMLQRRLRDPSRSAQARRLLMQRGSFVEALLWMEIHGDPIHGDAPDAATFWREELAGAGADIVVDDADGLTPQRRRRRRRPGRRRGPGPEPQAG